MLAFIKGNLSTIIVGAVVFGTIIYIVIRLVKNKRSGKTACGCGCSSCGRH